MESTIANPPSFRLRAEWAGDFSLGLDAKGVHYNPQSGERLFLDCPCCGTVQPAMRDAGSLHRVQHVPAFAIRLAVIVYWTDAKGKRRREMAARCGCGFWGRVRWIKSVGTDGKGKVGKDGIWYCSGACTGGRHSCDCRCGGACHGAGSCSGHGAAA